jgi:hypothetical protein
MVVTTMLSGSFGKTASCESGASTMFPAGGGVVIAATVYEGEGPGAYGYGLAGSLPYAELGLHSETDSVRLHANRIGLAFGLGAPLAPRTQLTILAPNGRSVVAEKRDIGMGGAPIEGHLRAIDLWTSTRQALGLGSNWSGLVHVYPGPSGKLATETGLLSESFEAPAETTGACGEGSVEVSAINQRIVQIAEREVNYTHDAEGWYCTKFGPCEQWCALFVTWVWRQAGVKIPSEGFSGYLYTWASEHTHVYGPTAHPQPGWAVLFGTGPQSTETSLHVGIVARVDPDGTITIINGDFAGKVMRTGPCAPSNAQGGCEEPAPIYGYASPT